MRLLVFVMAFTAYAQVSGPVVVYPTAMTIEIGTTRQMQAYVPISPNTVVWTVNDIAGGNSAVGTISQSGLYVAPAVAPTPNVVTVKATSAAFPAQAGSTPVTITRKYPNLWSMAPAQVSIGHWSVALNGNNFAPDSQVLVNGQVAQSAYVSPTRITVSGTVAQTGILAFAVRQPAPGQVTGNAVNLTVVAAPVSVAVSPSTASMQLGATKAFTASVSGSANTAVSWSATAGTVTPDGLYTAPAVMPPNGQVTVRATSVANAASTAQATVTLTSAPTNTPPSPALISAGRFLEQASFGPTPASLAKVQQMGIPAWLDEQFTLPETFIPTTDNNMSSLRRWILFNYSTANDQLRQRVAYSLGQILVVSANKLVYPDEILPWMRLMSKHAFGNYKDLLKELTVSPSMGKFLDLANSSKPGIGGGANENYPRELLQLFTIGLYKLKTDGTPELVPAYDQETIRQVSLALTGWTYPTQPGQQARQYNWEYYVGPMEPRQQSHDISPKSFLGCQLPGGQTVQQDLDAAIDCIFSHPNVPPFIATRLIRSLVTSNPSAAYIQRVAGVFANNGSNVRGDLKAVVRAILTDPEARPDTPSATHGRLKEPLLHTVGFVRALNGQFSPSNQVSYIFDSMAQSILTPPSVFNWFSPLYRVPKSPLFGPEFQIYTPTEATLRGNLFYYAMTQGGGDITVDLSPFTPYGNDMPGLVDAVDKALFYGRMSAQMKGTLLTAATPGYDAITRIRTALYLAALTGQYAVQH